MTGREKYSKILATTTGALSLPVPVILEGGIYNEISTICIGDSDSHTFSGILSGRRYRISTHPDLIGYNREKLREHEYAPLDSLLVDSDNSAELIKKGLVMAENKGNQIIWT